MNIWALFGPLRATLDDVCAKLRQRRNPRDATLATLILVIVSGCSAGQCSPATSQGSPTSQASPTSPTPSVTPNPTPPVGDACLPGTWTMSSENNPSGWSFNGQAVHVKGLAGELLIIMPGGADAVSWANSKPLVGTYQGRRLTILLRGHAAATVHAAGGLYFVSKISGTVTAAFNWGGTPESTGSVRLVGTRGLPYSCTAAELVIRYPGSTTDTYVRSG